MDIYHGVNLKRNTNHFFKQNKKPEGCKALFQESFAAFSCFKTSCYNGSIRIHFIIFMLSIEVVGMNCISEVFYDYIKMFLNNIVNQRA